MISKLKTIVLIIILVSCVSCAGSIETTASADSSRSAVKVYLSSLHLLRTCNAWTASALKAAGIPLGAFSAMSASRLMEHACQFAIAGVCPGTDCTGAPVAPGFVNEV